MKEQQNTYNFVINNTYDIFIERNIWKNYILDLLIELPDKCSLCANKFDNLTEINSIFNPYIGRCSNNKCRTNFFLKDYTIFGYFPKTMASTILYVIKLWIFK